MRATEAEIWGRTIRPDVGDLSPLTAREFLRWHLSQADAERVRVLSDKANAGTLKADEENELDFYLNVARALEFLKAKARLSLQDHLLVEEEVESRADACYVLGDEQVFRR